MYRTTAKLVWSVRIEVESQLPAILPKGVGSALGAFVAEGQIQSRQHDNDARLQELIPKLFRSGLKLAFVAVAVWPWLRFQRPGVARR